MQKQIILVYYPYKITLDNILDSNINDIVARTISTNPDLLRQIILATQQSTFLDIFLLSKLFNYITSNEDKISRFSIKSDTLLTLLQNTVFKNLSNFVLKLSNNYNKI